MTRDRFQGFVASNRTDRLWGVIWYCAVHAVEDLLSPHGTLVTEFRIAYPEGLVGV